MKDERDLIHKQAELEALEWEKHIWKEEKELNDKLEELKKDLKGSVFGFVYELITPIKDKFDLPLQIALKSWLNLFVVDSQHTAIKVDKFLSEKAI